MPYLIEMSHKMVGENGFHCTHKLIFSNTLNSVENSPPFDSPSPEESCTTPLSNGTFYSNTNSPSDSCMKPLCEARSPNENGFNGSIKYVSTEREVLVCGWGGFTPSCLQFFNTPKGVLFFLCMASFLQGMTVNGFINTVITSIERRFDLQSYQSGLIASSYDIAACVCLTFVSYFGGNGHKPRWLGWGVLIMGIGSLIFALPHFTTSQYEVHFSEEIGTCSSNQTAWCAESVSTLSNYQFVFMLGQFLHGIGATPLYTLGVTYLDENVKSNYSPVYIAVFYTAAILGPAAGYLIGGIFLNIYTEVGRQIDLTPDNSLWVGAWWIGFLGAGAGSLLISVPILGYPHRLPGSQRYTVMRVSETHQSKDGSHKTASDPDFGKTVKDLPQFENDTAVSSPLEGYLVVPAGGGGTFLGGFLVNKFKLRCSGIIKFCFLCTMSSLLAIFIFFTDCPNMPMAGVTQMHDGSILLQGHLNLSDPCNMECHCLRETYNPVCGNNGITYYSACHAGCKKASINHDSREKVYHECSCIVGPNAPVSGLATAGKCTSSCERRTLLLVFMFVIILFTFLSSIPALTATLRCVSDRQRSFALGIQWIVVRTLGSIPGPIAFGSMIDKSCLLWQSQCGEQGSCYVMGSCFFLLACLLYKAPPPESLHGSSALSESGTCDLQESKSSHQSPQGNDI
ncbi:hypothetical protein Chor_004217 [Crotalus horridus]